MIVFPAVHLAQILYARVGVMYCTSWAQKRGTGTQSYGEQDGVYRRGAMEVSCRWLMMLSAALSLRNWPEVIWVVSTESSICNEITNPSSAKRRDPALMLQERWYYCCTHMSCLCVWLSWLDFSGRGSNNSPIYHIIVIHVLVCALNSPNLILSQFYGNKVSILKVL